MTPENQVKEIIKMLAPEDPSSKDAVFLVKRFMESMRFRLASKEKEIAMLEEQVARFRAEGARL